MLKELFFRWGLEAAFVDMSNLDAVKNALRRRRNWCGWRRRRSTLKVVNITTMNEIVHKGGAISVCDNTWAPMIRRPLALGTDFVMHSTTNVLAATAT